MPVNAIAMAFSFAAAIDSWSLTDPPRLETCVRLAICDSLSPAAVVLLNDLEAGFLESQNRKPDPGFGFRFKVRNRVTLRRGAPRRSVKTFND